MATAIIGGPAFAQEGLPVQQFAPAPGGDNNYVTVQGTGVLPDMMPAVGIYLNYAHNPLILRRIGNGEEISLIEHHLQLDLIAALGLFDILEVGISIPLTLYQKAGDPGTSLTPAPVDSFTTGDIRLYPKVSILHDPEGFGLSFLALVTLPTGSPENLQGNDSVTIEPRVALEYAFTEQFRIGLTAGFIWRPEAQKLFNIDVGNELTFGAGIEYEVIEKELAIIAEGYGKYSLESDTQAEELPVEVGLAARWWPVQQHALTLGVARGLTEGYGAPDFRVYLGYNYTPKEDDDPDGDGIKSRVDQCPNDPEDFDNFQDEDGCPDKDNDRDGILDVKDKCPNDPEDFDGFEDTDGCPDTDNDKDGIPDSSDQCPNDPEDMDGFKDDDGCPDPDNDNDGVPDALDKCPADSEDKDAYEDDDGCPDPDNDGDGILDVDDRCPNKPGQDCDSFVDKCEIVILDRVEFKYDKDEIDEQKSKPILEAVAGVLKANPWITLIQVQGHTDADGGEAYNQNLSERRAAAVVAWLTNSGGIEGSRLTPKGFGKSKPIDTNKTPAGRQKNRRVQFIILEPTQENCKK
ncbi:MAG: OmpA family protein [Deltaproteobacteria bacterium]|nr:OmpA family protein [Deltaproteobacteria bacterium]